ncbi:hypothetical protein H5410_030711 [Solanum commersonii]|uniref:Uncharacterized protein n=1 Tax=Solanum commersonii TaxID=4109 RepID=A0A9J5YH06_SOLCO|nr:hypothetical protein H5410_030711 [Solanum commersonii]
MTCVPMLSLDIVRCPCLIEQCVDDGTIGAGFRLWYLQYERLLIGKPILDVDVLSGFVHFDGTNIVMSRGLFKLHILAL